MDKSTKIIYIAVDVVIFCFFVYCIVTLCNQQLVSSDVVRENSDMNTTVTSNIKVTDYIGYSDSSVLNGEIKYNGVFTRAEVYGAIMNMESSGANMDVYKYKIYIVDHNNSLMEITSEQIKTAQTSDDSYLKRILSSDKYCVYNGMSKDGQIISIYYKIV